MSTFASCPAPAPQRGAASLTQELRLRWFRYAVQALAGFWRDNAPGMAGMIAFFGFLSLIPLVILLLAFLGNVVGSTLSAREVQQLFHEVVPGLSQHQFLNTYWSPVHHSRLATSILGVISLLVGTLGLHDSVDWAVNRIWRSSRARAFWVSKLRGLAVMLWAAAFALLSAWFAWMWAVISGSIHGIALVGWIALVPSLALDVALFTALYKLTPTADVETVAAVIAGAIASLLWEASKIGFSWWVLEVSSYNRVYGPLAASVIVMMWIWISSMIFLFGAELCAVLQRAVPEEPAPIRRPIVV